MKGAHYFLLGSLTIISGFLGGAVATCLLGPVPAVADQGGNVLDRVKARSIEIVDEDGRPMIELGVKDGGPFLGLKRRNGTYCAITRELGNGGAASVIFGGGQKEQVSLMVEKGMPRLDLFRGGDSPLVKLQVVESGPGLAMKDNAGRTRLYLGQPSSAEKSPDGQPVLLFLDAKGDKTWRAP